MPHRPTAACLAVGSELLGDDRQDSNSLTVTRALAAHGIPVVEKRVVGDELELIAAAVRELMARVDVLVVTGGLGPTADDLTREAVAEALGRELHHDPDVEQAIRKRYASIDREMPAICRRMARVVDGSRPLPNLRGSAPGVLIEDGGRILVALPGVPAEMELMLSCEVAPVLDRWSDGQRRERVVLLLGGVLESEVEARVEHLYQRFGSDAVTILGSPGVVRLVLSAEGADAPERLSEMEGAFADVLGRDIAGRDLDSLAEVALRALGESSQTLAAAESCTGGMMSAALTDVPGSSEVFLGGLVVYSNQAKEDFVGVDRAVLEEHGAVSEPVARALAAGVRERFRTDWGVGITGIAGPGGGTEDKPVGTVHWAVAGPDRVWHRQRVFGGDRATVRRWSSNSALDLLRRCVRGQL